MTIIIRYWFSSFGDFFPIAMYSSYIIAFSVFLILASKEKEREAIHKNLLLIAAVINIISTGIRFFFPSGYTSYSPTDEDIMLINVLFYIAPSLLTYIPYVFSFGIVFFIFGYKNRREIGNYLLYSGISWTVFTIVASLTLFSAASSISLLPYVLDSIFDFPNFYLIFILQQALSVFGIFNVLAIIFLLIHAYINKDNILRIAGFIYLIGYMTMGLSSIPYYIQMMIS